jgi:hypothetical protein
MRYLELFENFRPFTPSKKSLEMRKPKFIGDVKQNVEIRIDIEAIGHTIRRQHRHGLDDKITEDEIIEAVELAVEPLTIALMQDEFDIYQREDDYPVRGIKEGELTRFIIRNKSTDLNIVCELSPGDWEFTLTIITVMKTPDFKSYKGQFVIEI